MPFVFVPLIFCFGSFAEQDSTCLIKLEKSNNTQVIEENRKKEERMSTGSKKSNSTVIHYKKNNIFYKMMGSGFLFFEMTGQSVVSFYDHILSFPEMFNRSLRRKNGFFFKINQSYLKWRNPNKSNITIKAATSTSTTNTQDDSTTSSSSFDSNNIYTTTTPTPLDTAFINTTDTTPTIISATSTPSSSSPSPSQSSSSSSKEQHLENELARLRAEFSKIMAAKSTNSTNTTTTTISSTPMPPPPPPPLPPVFKATALNIKKKNINGVAPDVNVNATPTKSMSIGDILRSGNGKVQLKKSDVVRSPGGTPIRDVTNKPSVVSTQDFIAMALKKKFQNVHVNDSPEVKKKKTGVKKTSNDSFFSDSDDDEFVDNKENKFITSY
ncbi:hypothetical protein DFA_07483 [Cavenderia fasciculata]|uniref:WH2 domain-containing protein n=1 Tax=Cavenderia fasciculata TaxID=261658 RepID=F4PWJ5_CACFS|nr:uncharacterized protein DFA_07483 [Cavenderia fasciculata]EGG20359.1 hypothetical protein DFA_07483 [Cavenderia fasciculata]|eukprot:XP_004367342.1 hypothetical protein DFA_07483 [Cavenderia fasciculata]